MPTPMKPAKPVTPQTANSANQQDLTQVDVNDPTVNPVLKMQAMAAKAKNPGAFAKAQGATQQGTAGGAGMKGFGEKPFSVITKDDPNGEVHVYAKNVQDAKQKYQKLGNPLGSILDAEEVAEDEGKPTMPKGTVRVDVSDVYDWYKLGKNIPNLRQAKASDFGNGPPSTIMSFGSEEEEHKYIKALKRLGLTTTDIDPVDPNPPKGMPRQKVDPTYNVAEGDYSPMTKDSMKQDKIRSLKNLIAIAKEQGRQLRVQELELELKKLKEQGVTEARGSGYKYKDTDDGTYITDTMGETLFVPDVSLFDQGFKQGDRRLPEVWQMNLEMADETGARIIDEAGRASFRASNKKRAQLNAMTPEERAEYDKKRAEQQRKRDDARLERERSKNKSVAEAQTDYQKRRQRERDIDAGKPVKSLPKNPQNDYFARRKKEKSESIAEGFWDSMRDAGYSKLGFSKDKPAKKFDADREENTPFSNYRKSWVTHNKKFGMGADERKQDGESEFSRAKSKARLERKYKKPEVADIGETMNTTLKTTFEGLEEQVSALLEEFGLENGRDFYIDGTIRTMNEQTAQDILSVLADHELPGQATMRTLGEHYAISLIGQGEELVENLTVGSDLIEIKHIGEGVVRVYVNSDLAEQFDTGTAAFKYVKTLQQNLAEAEQELVSAMSAEAGEDLMKISNITEGWEDMLKHVKDSSGPQPNGGAGVKKGKRYGGADQDDDAKEEAPKDADGNPVKRGRGRPKKVREALAAIQAMRKQVAEALARVERLPEAQRNSPQVQAMVDRLTESVRTAIAKNK